MKAKCPTCKEKIEGASSVHKPFCSRRCAEADLGRWLSGQYAVAYDGGFDTPDDSADLDALEAAMTEAIAEGRLIAGKFPNKDE